MKMMWKLGSQQYFILKLDVCLALSIQPELCECTRNHLLMEDV